jgi:hypothetical protein
MIKRAAARAVYGAGLLGVATAIGATINPYDDRITRATGRGLAVMGAVAAFGWAAKELGREDQTTALLEAARR